MAKHSQLRSDLWRCVRVIASAVAVLWLIEVIDFLVPVRLDAYGIRPRTVDGLWGVPVAPLLHASFAHVAANTVPFAVLGSLVYLAGARSFVLVTAFVVAFGGLGVWLFGGSGIHIGASGVVFGYFGFLLAHGYYQRRVVPVLVALGVAAVYGGLAYGMLPGTRGISWEGHLFGFLAGGYAARPRL